MAKSTAKVGMATVKKGPISTPFKDCAVPVPNQAGVWATVRNGENVRGGAKGTGGEMDEVTIVGVHGGGSQGPTPPPARRQVIKGGSY